MGSFTVLFMYLLANGHGNDFSTDYDKILCKFLTARTCTNHTINKSPKTNQYARCVTANSSYTAAIHMLQLVDMGEIHTFISCKKRIKNTVHLQINTVPI